MKNKIAVLAVNPVNGAGLFQYLEAFFENGIGFTTFAVAEDTQIKTNSGVSLQTDGVVADLKDSQAQYDALVFSCGDAMPKFGQDAHKPFNQDMLAVIRQFDKAGKILIGHCVAALIFEMADVAKGKKVAQHPFVKAALRESVATDEQIMVDGNLYTAQNEHAIELLIPELLKVLK